MNKREKFETFYREYANKLYSVAIRMVKNHEDALDIVQECFLRAYEKWENFRGDAKVLTYLYRITMNLSYDLLKKKNRESDLELKEGMVKGSDIIDSEKKIRDDRVLEKIDEEIDKLTEKQKAIFILKTYEQLSYKEIAKILNSKIGTIKATYFQILQKIRKKLKEQGVIRDEV